MIVTALSPSPLGETRGETPRSGGSGGRFLPGKREPALPIDPPPGRTFRASLGPSPEGEGEAKVATDFEALFIAQLLRAARAAHLADDRLAGDDTSFRDMQDRALATQIARAAPLGVAALLRGR